MARDKPTKPGPERDPEEKEFYSFRLPVEFRAYLAEMLEKEDRNKTQIMKRALAFYAHAFGHPWPEKPPKP